MFGLVLGKYKKMTWEPPKFLGFHVWMNNLYMLMVLNL
jgi:hypothetical protein